LRTKEENKKTFDKNKTRRGMLREENKKSQTSRNDFV
jgi:hypothetical protein